MIYNSLKPFINALLIINKTRQFGINNDIMRAFESDIRRNIRD